MCVRSMETVWLGVGSRHPSPALNTSVQVKHFTLLGGRVHVYIDARCVRLYNRVTTFVYS